jgi:hypothetical protein
MDEDQIKQAWLHGFVKPQDSPNFVLPVQRAELAQRGEKVLLRDLIRHLQRLLRECRRLRGGNVALAALVDLAYVPDSIALVAVDLDRGQAVELPLAPHPSLSEDDYDLSPGEDVNLPPAPTTAGSPPADPSGFGVGGAPADAGVHLPATSVDAPPALQGRLGAQAGVGHRMTDEEAKNEAALWLAWRILKRFAAGELQSYDEMDKAISESPVPNLTRQYVATVRSTAPDIVTARGLLRWTGLDGVRDPLPQLEVAGVDVRCWDVSEKSARGTVQVLRLHARSRQYAKILDPIVSNPRPLMIEVDVPAENTRALLEIAMPKGWSIRAVLSIGRRLLMPDRAIFTVIHAELPPQLSPDFCKVQIVGLIDAATAGSQQLGLWDETTS